MASPIARQLRALSLLIALGQVAACGGCGEPGPVGTTAPSASGSASVAPTLASAGERQVVLDFIADLPSCDIDHRGPLLDMGTPAVIGRFGWRGDVPPSIETAEHHGSSWARIFDRRLELSFVVTARSPIFVSARAVGHLSKSAQVLLDDQPLGSLRFTKDDIRIASTGTTTFPVDAGLHTLTMIFSGKSRTKQPFAEIDWVRVGVPDDDTATYGAPSLHNTLDMAASLSNVPHRSLALRPPGLVRCALRVPPGATLSTAIGVRGPGQAEAEVRIVRDGEPTAVVRQVHVEGGDEATWSNVLVPLDSFAGKLVGVELAASSGVQGTRVVFGDPAIIIDSPPPPKVGRARAAVVVVLDGVARADLAPYSPDLAEITPNLAKLAESAAVFDRHRAPTTVVPAVVASLLTALPPPAHALVDGFARIPAAQTTLAGIARDASVRTAMFTGVPTTFGAFGFDDGWIRFTEHSPSSGAAATAPLDDAAEWMKGILKDVPDARLFILVHARGGHPPWDVTSKEMGNLASTEYNGPIDDPRRAAQVIATLRDKRVGGLSEADRQRIRSLSTIALAGQDRAIGALIDTIRAAGLWDDTLFVVTGDVAVGGSDSLPYADGVDLKESSLTLPMLVHFPKNVHAGERVDAPTEIYDIGETVAGSLGLKLSRDTVGRDLASVAAGLPAAVVSPQVAMLNEQYSVRLDQLVLKGSFGKTPSICDLDLDPTCAFDRRPVLPLATQALFRYLVETDVATRAPKERREAAVFDPQTVANLSVWGIDIGR